MKVTVDGLVWLDKASVGPRLDKLRAALTVIPESTSEYEDGPPTPLKLYAERGDLIGIPRGFYVASKQKDNEEVLNVSLGQPMTGRALSVGFAGSTSGTPRFDEQTKVHNLFLPEYQSRSYHGAMLQAGCSFGKTSLSLRLALSLGRSTIIVVHKEFFIRQWMERIKQFAPGATIGIVRQGKCDYKGKDFVIALVQSLSRREYPADFYSAFGFLIADEAHILGAQSWSGAIQKFSAAYRLGLTATPRRKDGCDNAFFYHIGDIGYKAVTQGTGFTYSRINLPNVIKPLKRGHRWIPVDQLTSGDIDTLICEDEVTTQSVSSSVIAAARLGRKIMVVSSRLEQLWNVSKRLSAAMAASGETYTVGWVTGEVYKTGPDGERLRTMRTLAGKSKEVWDMRKPSEGEYDEADRCQIILTTKQMTQEGYDNAAIDTVLLASPMSDIEQVVGRGRRPCLPGKQCDTMCPWRAGTCQGKPECIVKDVVHSDARLSRKADRRRDQCLQIGGRLANKST